MLVDGVVVTEETAVELAAALHRAGNREIAQRIGWAVDLGLAELNLTGVERHAVLGVCRTRPELGDLYATLTASGEPG